MGKVDGWRFHASAAEESTVGSKKQGAAVFSCDSSDLGNSALQALNVHVYSAQNSLDAI